MYVVELKNIISTLNNRIESLNNIGAKVDAKEVALWVGADLKRIANQALLASENQDTTSPRLRMIADYRGREF